MLRLAAVIVIACAAPAAAQLDVTPHRPAADRLITAALKDSAAYKRLARHTR